MKDSRGRMEAHTHVCREQDHGAAVYGAGTKYTSGREGLVISISPWFSDIVPLLFFSRSFGVVARVGCAKWRTMRQRVRSRVAVGKDG
jgi:hypothetical protein